MSGTYDIVNPITGEVVSVNVETTKNNILSNIFISLHDVKCKIVKRYEKLICKKNFIVFYEFEMKKYKIIKCILYKFENGLTEINITDLVARRNHVDGCLNTDIIRNKLKNKNLIGDDLTVIAFFYQEYDENLESIHPIKCVNVDLKNNIYINDKSHIMFNIVDFNLF